MRVRVIAVGLGGFVLLLAAAPGSSSPAAPQPVPRVTLISDSVAGAISFDTGAEAILAQGIDLFLEPGQARLLGGKNPAGGIAPPTTLQLIGMLGHRLGPTAIICVGDNDYSDEYTANVEPTLDALHRAGVKHVLWVTLHVSPFHKTWPTMNAAIEAAATHHPEVYVVDWNAYASVHPAWFQPDAVHLTGDGPRAMARLLHASLVKLGIPAARA